MQFTATQIAQFIHGKVEGDANAIVTNFANRFSEHLRLVYSYKIRIPFRIFLLIRTPKQVCFSALLCM